MPAIPAFAGELNQVWTNLIDNAIFALDKNGILTIETSLDDKNVMVSVIDNGKGIPEDILSRIFEPFYTTKKMGEGTGIGLDIVNRIVKDHNGDIKVSVLFPAGPFSLYPYRLCSIQHHKKIPFNMKLPYIILVDDDLQVLHAIQRDIRNEYRDAYKIAATESALEALELIKELKLKNEAVAMFISDQRMPEMEGIRFLELASEIFPDARKVLLTAYSDIEAAIRAINTVKLDYYLQKPWHPPEEKLFPVVNDLLNEWQALYKPDMEATRIIGFQWSPKAPIA